MKTIPEARKKKMVRVLWLVWRMGNGGITSRAHAVINRFDNRALCGWTVGPVSEIAWGNTMKCQACTKARSARIDVDTFQRISTTNHLHNSGVVVR